MVKAAYKELDGMFIDGMVSVEESSNQMRWFLSKIYGDRLVYTIGQCPGDISSTIEAGKWIRKYGHTHLTNDSFKGLISDIVGRSVSDEEANTARVISGHVAAYMKSMSYSMFLTEEEVVEWKKKQEEHKDTSGRYHIIKTVLGTYVQLDKI